VGTEEFRKILCNSRDKSEMLCAIFLKIAFFLSNVTEDLPELFCSHFRAPLIYAEALASNCTLWGVQPDGSDLSIRYDTQNVKGDGRCLVPDTEGKVP
jgi:hypothetical protein